MLDKTLCDQAKEDSIALFNGHRVAIYQWKTQSGEIRHCYSVEGMSEYIQNQFLANYGDPIAWGFSHRDQDNG